MLPIRRCAPARSLLSWRWSRPSPPAADDPNPAKAEAELKAVRAQIDKVRAEMERDAGRRDKLTRELEESEKTRRAARAASSTAAARARRAHRAARRARRRSGATEEAALARERAALAGQIRAAPDDRPGRAAQTTAQPAGSGAGRPRVRLLPVFRPRARRPDRARSTRTSASSPRSTRSWPRRKRGSPRSKSSARASCRSCTSARERRGRALVTLETESKNRAKELERLKDQQGGLEKLVRELRRALERIDKFPTDSKDAFAQLRGKLAWPVSGKLSASFGQTRAGGVKWDGVLVSARAGRAGARRLPRPRRVRGLAVRPRPADHHRSRRRLSQPLRPQRAALQGVGERVTAGDTIAAAGTPGDGRPPRCTSRSARPAGRSTPGPGSGAPPPSAG